MNIEFLPVAAAGVIMMLLSVTVRDIKKEYAIIMSVISALLLMMWGISRIGSVINKITEFMELSSMDSKYSEILLKALGISICTKLAKDVCADAGENAIAGKIEFCGKICMLLLSLPLFEELLMLAKEIVLA